MAATLPGTLPATRASETSGSPHPLDPLTVAELEVAAQVLVQSGRLGERPLLAWMALLEPPKAAVTAWRTGEPPLARQAMCVAVDRATGTTYEAVVDVTSGEILRADPQPGRHAPIQPLEWMEAGPAVRADARVQAALLGRGITDPATVVVEPWPAAYFGEEIDQLGRRLGRAILFVREHDGDTPVGSADRGAAGDRRPFDGARWSRSATAEPSPVPSDPGRMGADDPGIGPLREDLKPLVITQPDGAELHARRAASCDGSAGRCGSRCIRSMVSCCTRSPTTIPATGRIRPICYRASLSEMVVPYARPRSAVLLAARLRRRRGRARDGTPCRSPSAATASVRCTTWTRR